MAATTDAVKSEAAAIVEAWRAGGRFLRTLDGQVFLTEIGEANDAAPIVLLHGFPTSSWDFAPLMQILGKRRRVVAFDFLGFGLSDKPPGFGYALHEQTDVALAVLRELGITRAHVVAHDMGTSVATELCARRERGLLPVKLETLTLMNGSVHVELASLTFGQRLLRTPLAPLFARLSGERGFEAQFRRIFAKQPTALEVAVMWQLVAREGGAGLMPKLIGYVDERHRYPARWIGALERLDLPTLIAWGRRDPVAVFAIAEQLAREIRGARAVTWDELGHYPQVEDPARVARTIESFLEGRA